MSGYNGCFMRKRKKIREKNLSKYGKLTCEYCGKANLRVGQGGHSDHNIATIDHFIPTHMGGDNSWKNLYLVCAKCNFDKGGKHPSELEIEFFNKKLNQLIRK